MNKVLRALPIAICISLLLVSCATRMNYPDIRPDVEKLYDAMPDDSKMELTDPMVYYWDVAYNSMVLADAAAEWKDFSLAEESFISEVTRIWPTDIEASSGLVLALVPNDPEMVEHPAPIAYMYLNYANHVEMYVNWKGYAQALADYIDSLTDFC